MFLFLMRGFASLLSFWSEFISLPYFLISPEKEKD
jgi:hypothetical protein